MTVSVAEQVEDERRGRYSLPEALLVLDEVVDELAHVGSPAGPSKGYYLCMQRRSDSRPEIPENRSASVLKIARERKR
jgi:hypothetical protein